MQPYSHAVIPETRYSKFVTTKPETQNKEQGTRNHIANCQLHFAKKFKKVIGIKKISLIFAAAIEKDSKTA